MYFRDAKIQFLILTELICAVIHYWTGAVKESSNRTYQIAGYRFLSLFSLPVFLAFIWISSISLFHERHLCIM